MKKRGEISTIFRILLNPKQADFHAEEGRTLAILGNTILAVEFYEQALQLAPIIYRLVEHGDSENRLAKSLQQIQSSRTVSTLEAIMAGLQDARRVIDTTATLIQRKSVITIRTG